MLTLRRISLYAFLLAIVLMRLPNFYFLPFVTSGIFTSQAIARGIFILLFLLIFFIFKNSSFSNSKDKVTCNILLLLFLLTSSLSLIWAQNVEEFFIRYKDVVISILCFFIFQYFAFEKKKISFAFLLAFPINIVYQLLLLYGGNMVSIIQNIIYEKHFALVSYNLYRGRVYTENYDEAFISLLILFLQSKKKKNVFGGFTLLIFLSSLAFLSNFRTRLLMLLGNLISSLIILQKITIKKISLFLLGIIFIAFMIQLISSFKWGYTFYDRFILSNQIDVVSVFSRVDQIKNAFQMGRLSPFGVGLGNYYDVLEVQRSVYYAFMTSDYQSSAYQFIHNNIAEVIAESGYISAFFYLLLLVKFFFMDKVILEGNDKYKKAFVISFWTLFFFGLFNPPLPGSYQIFFWGIRGLLF